MSWIVASRDHDFSSGMSYGIFMCHPYAPSIFQTYTLASVPISLGVDFSYRNAQKETRHPWLCGLWEREKGVLSPTLEKNPSSLYRK